MSSFQNLNENFDDSFGNLNISDLPHPGANKKADVSPRKRIFGTILMLGLLVVIILVLVVSGGVSSYEWGAAEEEGSSTANVQGDSSFYRGNDTDAPSDPDGRGENRETMKAHYFPEEYYDGTAEGISTKALCNNLDRSVYWMTEGSETKNFAIYMPGGASCQDEDTCADRNETRHEDMEGPTEEELEEGKYGRGITQIGFFHSEYANSFADYNLVELHYCSSDSYIGRRDKNDPANLAPEWHFGGDAQLWGMFQGLLDNHGLAAAENIFITSSSAGAAGIFQQMDRMIAFLKVEAPNANVKFAYDNGWHLHGIPTFDEYVGTASLSRTASDDDTKQDQLDCWYPNMNERCMNEQPEDEQYMCFYTGNVLYDYLENQEFWVHLHEFDQKGYGASQTPIDTWDDDRFNYSIFLAGQMVGSLQSTDEALTSFTLPASREHDSFDKGDWQQEYMPMTQQGEDYWDDYDVYGVPDDAVVLCDFMKSYLDNEFPVPVRVYDACLYPYCNPTSARLPFDEDWDSEATGPANTLPPSSDAV